MNRKRSRAVGPGLAILLTLGVVVVGGIGAGSDPPPLPPDLTRPNSFGVADENGNPVSCADGKPLEVVVGGPPTGTPAPAKQRESLGPASEEEQRSVGTQPRCKE